MRKKESALIKFLSIHQFALFLLIIQTLATVLMTIFSEWVNFFTIELIYLMAFPFVCYNSFASYYNNLDLKKSTMEVLPIKNKTTTDFYKLKFVQMISIITVIDVGIAVFAARYMGNVWNGLLSVSVFLLIGILFLLFRKADNHLNANGFCFLICLCFIEFIVSNYIHYK